MGMDCDDCGPRVRCSLGHDCSDCGPRTDAPSVSPTTSPTTAPTTSAPTESPTTMMPTSSPTTPSPTERPTWSCDVTETKFDLSCAGDGCSNSNYVAVDGTVVTSRTHGHFNDYWKYRNQVKNGEYKMKHLFDGSSPLQQHATPYWRSSNANGESVTLSIVFPEVRYVQLIRVRSHMGRNSQADYKIAYQSSDDRRAAMVLVAPATGSGVGLSNRDSNKVSASQANPKPGDFAEYIVFGDVKKIWIYLQPDRQYNWRKGSLDDFPGLDEIEVFRGCPTAAPSLAPTAAPTPLPTSLPTTPFPSTASPTTKAPTIPSCTDTCHIKDNPPYFLDGFCDEVDVGGPCERNTDCTDCGKTVTADAPPTSEPSQYPSPRPTVPTSAPTPGPSVVCDDSCLYSKDGRCDRGTRCRDGTDCTDCGPPNYAPTWKPETHKPTPSPSRTGVVPTAHPTTPCLDTCERAFDNVCDHYVAVEVRVCPLGDDKVFTPYDPEFEHFYGPRPEGMSDEDWYGKKVHAVIGKKTCEKGHFARTPARAAAGCVWQPLPCPHSQKKCTSMYGCGWIPAANGEEAHCGPMESRMWEGGSPGVCQQRLGKIQKKYMTTMERTEWLKVYTPPEDCEGWRCVVGCADNTDCTDCNMPEYRSDSPNRDNYGSKPYLAGPATCSDSCYAANNGVCDYDNWKCALLTDCSDCGEWPLNPELSPAPTGPTLAPTTVPSASPTHWPTIDCNDSCEFAKNGKCDYDRKYGNKDGFGGYGDCPGGTDCTDCPPRFCRILL